jgi:hypothetical protein
MMSCVDNNDDFAQPRHIVDNIVAFGVDVRDLLPRYDDIPEEFRNGNTKWNAFQSDWFFSGITKTGLIAKDGIDLNAALRHLQAINSSFEPKHEHKEAAVAYLASRWLDDASTWEKIARP